MKPPQSTTAAPAQAEESSAARELAFTRAILDALPDHIYVKDLQGRYLLVNEAGLRERNTALEQIAGKTAYDLVPHEVAEGMSAEDRRVIETGMALVNREARTAFPGAADEGRSSRWHITTKIPMRDLRGEVVGIIGINRDITDRKRAEMALAESEQMFRAIFEQAAVGITVVSPDLRYLRANDRFCEMLGYRREDLLSMTLGEVTVPEARDEAIAYRSQLLAGTAGQWELRERQLLRKDRSRIWAALATSLVRAEDGTPRYFISVVQDISEAKRAAAALRESEERFRHLAHYDGLTNLPNRALFHDRLKQALAQAARNRWIIGVMLLDLDRFKQVNDTLGHAAGDLLLNQVAARLTHALRSDDTAARLGGDEFGVMLSTLSAPQDAGIVAHKIIACFEDPFPIEGRQICTGVSIGIALYPGDGSDLETLIKNADTAMYRAKAAGRNGYQFYAPQLAARARQIMGNEDELRPAFERNEFVLHYQPKADIATGALVGAEALLRWQHPGRGLVGPSEFMPLLQEGRLMANIGAWVLEAVCTQLAQWRRQGLATVPVAVNLFPRQFIRRDLGSIITRLMGQYHIGPQQLELEVTESALMDPEEAQRALQEMRALEVKCSIDDFGTGYSSLSTLRRFALDALKIDRSFVQALPHDADAAAISRAVISLAHSLGLQVIAEGVENAAQLEFLAAHGCDQAQGYYFARPMPAAQFAEWLTAK